MSQTPIGDQVLSDLPKLLHPGHGIPPAETDTMPWWGWCLIALLVLVMGAAAVWA